MLEARMLPQSRDSEQAVIGAAMISNDAAAQVAAELTPEDYYVSANGKIHKAIASLVNKGQPVDLLSVPEELRRLDLLEEVGGVEYVHECAESVPTAAHRDYYLGIVTKKSTGRQAIAALGTYTNAFFAQEEDPDDLLLDCAETLRAIGNKRSKWEVYSAAELFPERKRQILAGEKPHIFRLGVSDLDAILRIKPGDLIIVAGPTSVGKSATCLDWCYHGIKNNFETDYLTFEMSKLQCLNRLIAARSDIPERLISGGAVHPEDHHLIEHWADVLTEAPLRFIERGLDCLEILTLYMKDTVRRNGTQLMFIDQLGELSTRTKHDRDDLRLGYIAKTLKRGAVENRLAVILMHQVNRNEDERGRPTWRNLRGSGMIAEYADAVVMLWQPDRRKNQGKAQDEPDEVPIEWIISKQRDGPTGIVRRTFRKSTQRMCDWLDEFDEDDIPPAAEKAKRLFNYDAPAPTHYATQ